MRRYLVLMTLIGACSVPDKQPLSGDGGIDAEDDDGPPETTITESPNEFSNAGTATFKFTSNQSTATFECSIDGEPAMPCVSPFSRSLPDGTHSFSVRAVNTAGDSDDTPAERLWSIDTVAPNTTLTEAPPSADNSVIVRFAFTSTEQNVLFECSLDNAPFVACRSNDELGPIGDGAHAFSVRARDRAGNVDASPAIHAWAVDTSTPDTQILSGPMGSSPSAIATFSFLSPDAGPGATFQCSIDGSPFADCVSPAEFGSLSMGVHTFAVRVRDVGGNFDPTPATRTWTVDLTPPETTITSGPTGIVAMASASFEFVANEDNVTFACSLDGSAPTLCASPFNATMLSQGTHTFSVSATDAAGHTDPTPASSTWTIDTVAPDILITSGPENGTTSGPRVVFTFTVSEGVVECRIDTEMAWLPCADSFAFNSAPGPRAFFVRSTDAAGNVTTVSRFFEVMCFAPDATGAVGVLHFEDGGQILTNATGGASATLGPTDAVELADPTYTTGRFGMGLAFAPAENDQISWPLAAGASSEVTIELWSNPDAAAGTRDVLVTGDARIAIRITAASASTVQYSASFVDSGGVTHTVTSAAVAANTPHDVLVSLQEPTLRMWIDGTLFELGNVRLGAAAALDSIRLGGTYSGWLDEIWLSQLAITTTEAARARYCPASGFTL